VKIPSWIFDFHKTRYTPIRADPWQGSEYSRSGIVKIQQSLIFYIIPDREYFP
jgi:hypothetical protein